MKKSIIAVLSGVLLFSCAKKEEAVAQETYAISGDQITLTDLQKKTAGIETTTLNNENIANKILLTGQINVPPTGMAGVSSSTGGIIKTARFVPGNYVTRGQTLAVVENPELARLQQEYLQSKSNLGYAQKDYNRQKYLNKYQASSDKVTQKAANEAQSQGAAVRGIESQLRSYGINPGSVSSGNIRKSVSVVAPISGYISRVNATIGQYVSSADVLYEIVNNGQTHLALKVFEKDLNKISVGQNVYAFTNQNPEKKYAAVVKLIGKDFAPDRSVLIHCDLIDKNESLIPGTFMNAEIEVNAEKGFVIPDDAIVTWEGKQYIFEEIKPKTYKMFPVTIGNAENGLTELLNFDVKNANKAFVTKGAYHLLMALKNVEE
ncbi:efflux RND transporter periplasmic adaptor subunit [Chryseobacterium sp. VAUSW3]|uniref:efflux RND transporter periplasmic adaptor subunit n=1 Tax=Chryseobacterium sp. VAUSW3 TaxID=2010998 RepID=UPI000B4C2E30|nr:efflux RND transporter periplasmic adaptor subunit [Chryseobacterium sp. VAUSW3]OWR14347.1 efflux transporter periplasmic adaptor subunit [Chryseobacterium sp. VAUSW3]